MSALPEAQLKHRRSAGPHRQLLMHAQVYNQNGECSERFVDHQIFELWQHLMMQRHGFKVHPAGPLLWLPADELARHPELFETHPGIQVTRIACDCYDPDTGITTHKVRFFPTAEQAHLTGLLARHLRQGVSSVQIDAGQALAA